MNGFIRRMFDWQEPCRNNAAGCYEELDALADAVIRRGVDSVRYTRTYQNGAVTIECRVTTGARE